MGNVASSPRGGGASPTHTAVSLLPHTLSQSISERVGRAVSRTGLTPNALTLIGLFGMGGAGYLASIGWFWQAGVVMLAAGAFDLFDGAVARYTGQASDWGAIFDAVSDRLADFAILFGLLFWFIGEERFDRTAIVLIALSLSGSMLVSYTRSKAAEFGIQIRSGLGTRLERILILVIGLLSGQVVAVLWLLAALSNLTALQRWVMTWLAARQLEREDAELGVEAAAQESPFDREL